MGLLALMAYTGGCAVADPRDRVYSLLGLARPSNIVMMGTPTYGYEVGVVYTALVKVFIDTYPSLDIICFAQLFRAWTTGIHSGPRLPSWAPDWAQSMELSVIPLIVSQSGAWHISNFRPLPYPDTVPRSSVHAASGREPPQAIFSEDFRKLTCKGILIDYIDGLGGVQYDSSIAIDPSADPNLIQSDSPPNAPPPSNNDKDKGDQTNLLDFPSSAHLCSTATTATSPTPPLSIP
ncbi:hypothetical protein B0T14DRAFT_564072 [Immersiella caudata]|uniref:Uncharacterized protein n=1 Tax=Immersiella caudata TaxID=314043 RepID=A0AA39WWN4_9PEZI|nr:hypothetical protein B0T14DRAFT_564072 [Immersiella caudata]